MNRLAALLKRNILSTAIMASIGVAVNADAQTTCAPVQANSIEHNKSGGHAMGQAELEARGKALRQEIDTVYRELEAPGGRFYDSPRTKINEVDVSDIVLKYIPIGMSFEDIETILKAADWNFYHLGPGAPPLPNGLLVDRPHTGIEGGRSLVADMNWFTSFGIAINSDKSDGHCAFMVKASFFKQPH